MIWVVGAPLGVPVRFTSTYPPAGRDPPAGATLTFPARPGGTLTVKCATGPPAAVSTKNPLAGFPLFDVSSSLSGATSRYPRAGEVDGAAPEAGPGPPA